MFGSFGWMELLLILIIVLIIFGAGKIPQLEGFASTPQNATTAQSKTRWRSVQTNHRAAV